MNNTKRYNVFNNIHKGLRTMLFSTQIKWQQTDFTSPEAASVVANLETVLYYYDEHADHEDNFILSKIIQQEPQIAAALEEDHVVDHELSQKLRGLINQWKDASSDEAKEGAAAAVFYRKTNSGTIKHFQCKIYLSFFSFIKVCVMACAICLPACNTLILHLLTAHLLSVVFLMN